MKSEKRIKEKCPKCGEELVLSVIGQEHYTYICKLDARKP